MSDQCFLAVGAARSIVLEGPEGDSDGCSLELRRLFDGTLILRICEPGCRAGVGYPASASLATIAGALAHGKELRIDARAGHYMLLRDQEWLHLSYFSAEKAMLRSWRAKLTPILVALKSLGSNTK